MISTQPPFQTPAPFQPLFAYWLLQKYWELPDSQRNRVLLMEATYYRSKDVSSPGRLDVPEGRVVLDVSKSRAGTSLHVIPYCMGTEALQENNPQRSAALVMERVKAVLERVVSIEATSPVVVSGDNRNTAGGSLG